MIVYHGTIISTWNKIKKGGFINSDKSGYQWRKGNYVTTDQEMAHSFSYMDNARFGEDIVVIEITVPPEEEEHFIFSKRVRCSEDAINYVCLKPIPVEWCKLVSQMPT